MAFWDNEIFIGDMEKNNGNILKFKITELDGKEYIDIREFWYDQHSKDYKPSKKGIVVGVNNYEDFKALFDMLDMELKDSQSS
ncbi:MAG: transcriptional coactivator p15/PC4 family protein [Bacillota bacterium]